MRMSVRARRGDTLEWSVFARSFGQRVRHSRSDVGDAVQRVTASPLPGAVRVSGRRYYGASDPKLRRVRMRWRVRRGRTVAVTTCAR